MQKKNGERKKCEEKEKKRKEVRGDQHIKCCNPSLGLATKARAYEGVGQM